MENTSDYFNRILHKLAGNNGRSFTLEELTILGIPTYNVLKTFEENISIERENQAKILDALILLDYHQYIILNPITDESFITIKGLIKINNIAFCN